MLNSFSSPCGSDFHSVSVCIAMNKPCVPKTSDYLILGLCAEWLLVWTEKDWKFSLWTWPLLLLLAIVLQIWGRRSTTLSYGIGLFRTSFNPQCCYRRLRSAEKQRTQSNPNWGETTQKSAWKAISINYWYPMHWIFFWWLKMIWNLE